MGRIQLFNKGCLDIKLMIKYSFGKRRKAFVVITLVYFSPVEIM